MFKKKEPTAERSQVTHVRQPGRALLPRRERALHPRAQGSVASRSRRAAATGSASSGMAIAVLTTLAITQPHRSGARRARRRRHHRLARRQARRDDADAGAGGGDALAGRPGRGAHRHRRRQQPGGVQHRRSDSGRQPRRAVHRHVRRRDDVLGLGDRLRQAGRAGQDVPAVLERAGRLQGPALRQPGAGARDDRLRHRVLRRGARRALAAVHRR